MSQLFTVYFPKYHFVLQKEFSITFEVPLPFDYGISHSGIVYVDEIHWNDEQYTDIEIESWKLYGLQQGLTIISINDSSLIPQQDEDDEDEHEDDDDDEDHSLSHRQTIFTMEQIQDMITNDTSNAHHTVTITFREELFPIEDAQPIGLTYSDDMQKQKQKHMRSIPFHPSSQQSSGIILDKQISASSCQQNHEPNQCRFNHPKSFWKPSLSDQKLRNVWISFNLGRKTLVTAIAIQGNVKHDEYISSLYIDYSDDGCSFVSHPMRCIKCKYMEKLQMPMDTLRSVYYLEDESNTDQNPYQSEYKYAVIKIWPSIDAQFIRIRPQDWVNNIALRMELYGPKQQQIEFGRVVTANTVIPSHRSTLMELLKNKPADTKVIQINLKAVVCAALDRAGLRQYGIVNADDEHYICTFTTPCAMMSEQAMDFLAEAGIGREVGVISVSAIEWRSAPQHPEHMDPMNNTDTNVASNGGFYESIHSRMVVKQVVERIMNSSAFTFDYLLLLISASLIAVGGLATNNSVIIVASMLVSPLMGPVVAFTFGVTLKQRKMVDLGLKNELLSMLICIGTGFVFGYLYAVFTMNRNHWPTDEMASRGKMIALADGAFIAAASGIGVALSVLGEYIAAVVGCAISASLLPPAVNCGMLISFPFYEAGFDQYVHRDSDPQYDSKEIIWMAMISLALTIENVIIIFLVGRCMFAVKNVYIAQDHNRNVWQSVHNCKQQHSRMKVLNRIPDTVMHNAIPDAKEDGDESPMTEMTTEPMKHRFYGEEYSFNPTVHNALLRQQSVRFKNEQSNATMVSNTTYTSANSFRIKTKVGDIVYSNIQEQNISDSAD
eukprot:21135_1